MENSKNKVLSLTVCMIVLTILLAFNVTAFAAENTFEVSNEAGFLTAITEINAAVSGEFIIKLTDDIQLTKGAIFTKNTTTILGQEHTIYAEKSSAQLYVHGDGTTPWDDIVLNLGSPDGSDILTIKGITKAGASVPSGSSPLVQCEDSTLNMYEGVTISNATGSGYGAGLLVSGNFNMYGGSITQNTSSHFMGGGGVGIIYGTMNMYGGSITKNKSTGLYGNGGGIIIYNHYITTKSVFNMYGGTISDNEAKKGGGISAGAYMTGESYYETYLNLYGGRIVNNKASVLGGGVYIAEDSLLNVDTTIAPKVALPDAAAAILNASDAEYGDSVTITGNTNTGTNMADNLALADNNYIADEESEPIQTKITIDTLTEGTQIGITLGQPTTEIEFTKDYRSTNPDVSPVEYFTSDSDEYIIADFYADGATEPSEVRLAKDLPVTFETMADAGYYSEERNSDNKDGVISLNILITNFDSIKGNIVEYGLYVTSDKQNAKEITVVDNDVAQLELDGGYYHAIVLNIIQDEFDVVYSGSPFVKVDTDGDFGTTDDQLVITGDVVASTSVSAVNKWLGAVNEYK